MGKCIKLWQRARDREIDEGSGVAVTQQTTTTHRIDIVIVVTITFLIYMKNRIGALTQVREKMSNNIAKLEEEIPDAKTKKKLTAFRKARKVTYSSIFYNGVERILKGYRIISACYHKDCSPAPVSRLSLLQRHILNV
jgi:hypothetical protein